MPKEKHAKVLHIYWARRRKHIKIKFRHWRDIILITLSINRLHSKDTFLDLMWNQDSIKLGNEQKVWTKRKPLSYQKN